MTSKTANKPTALQPAERLDPRYTRRLTPDPAGGYTATILEFPGCIAEGDTAEEALRNLEQTALSWMRSARANGYPVCEPIDYEGASGKVALRISRRLHQLATERADMEGTSLNQFIGNALATYLGQQDGMQRTVQALRNAVHENFLHFYADSLLATSADVINDKVTPPRSTREGRSTDEYVMIGALPARSAIGSRAQNG